jgi:hypothetical protein
MTNDKDSAVLAEKVNIEWLAQQLLDWPDKRTDEAKTMAIGTLHRMASATILSQHQELAALRQSTQSDTHRKTPIWTEAATIQTNGRWKGKTARSDALREAIANKICHAQYNEDIDNQMYVSPRERQGCFKLADAALAALQEQSK